MKIKKITSLLIALFLGFGLLAFINISTDSAFAETKPIINTDPGSAADIVDEPTEEEKAPDYDPLGGLSPEVTNPTTTTSPGSGSVKQETDTEDPNATSTTTTEKELVDLATSPAECTTVTSKVDGKLYEPRNCIFLEEPIGGKTGYDLYIIECVDKQCAYNLWRGGALTQYEHGPVQAVLTSEEDKEYQGPFGLLYNYLSLIYKYMSGVIVGVAVLFVVVGGIQMSTSGGDQAKFDAGKSRIVKAIVGMILWFTASLLLYTINPTFFGF